MKTTLQSARVFQLGRMFGAILLALGTLVCLAQPALPQFQSIGLQGQSAALSLSGPTNQYNAIEASTNLIDWTPLTSLLTSGNAAGYTDHGATNLMSRFYRALAYTK